MRQHDCHSTLCHRRLLNDQWLTPEVNHTTVADGGAWELHHQLRMRPARQKPSSSWAQHAGCAQGTAASALRGSATMLGHSSVSQMR
jgi:hypothetical protein